MVTARPFFTFAVKARHLEFKRGLKILDPDGLWHSGKKWALGPVASDSITGKA